MDAERHAEVIPLEQGRASRDARGARQAGADRSGTPVAAADEAAPARVRCAAGTAEGRPCRNYAVDGELCRVHAARSRAGRGGSAPASTGRTPPVAGGSQAGSDSRAAATDAPPRAAGASEAAAIDAPPRAAGASEAAATDAPDPPAAGPTRTRAAAGAMATDGEPASTSAGAASGPATSALDDLRDRLQSLAHELSSAAFGGLPAALPPGAVDVFAALRELGGDVLVDQLPDVLAFARRRLTGDYEIDEFGFDEDLTTSVLMPLLRPLHRAYWRVGSYGAEHLPADGGGLVVANHAGTLPADALITRYDIFERTGRHARELGADLVFRTPFVGELARKTGATLASGDDADRLLRAGELVAVWPEGYKGLGKPWKDRYKLQRFGRGGFVATALRAQVPIVPTAIVGSEEIYPLVFDLRIVARLLGLPYFPVVAQLFALPVLGPFALLPLPSKWVIEYGEPIDTSDYGPEAADDPMVLFDLADLVRDRIQGMLHRNLMGRRSVFL